MEGIIIVDKPAGWTSFDVVAKIRNLSKVKKVGHSGTLDPIATGVLPVFLGSATKQIDRFLNGDKGYLAEMMLGIKTDTGDADGKTIATVTGKRFTGQEIEKAFEKYRGKIKQVPPMYSAIKIKGKKLYELARKGIVVEREAREITIHKLELIRPEGKRPGSELIAGLVDGWPVPLETDYQRVVFYVECSKGTYIRKLIEDIGDDLGCGAHMTRLVRTYAHPFHLSQALTMETIVTLAQHGQLATVVIKPEEVLTHRSDESERSPLSIGNGEGQRGK
ncbi:tRNA pseudouridine(55) synthase TruB [candidate division WOR-1 bacterium RIFOXYA12_FULL_52_29]|uniref:tRNA pseudouridine synthase B n=1 Tax=candidate division WOR-1 bacterium RIFOXYC12_FULL_54_18 TaxID=1802584 RepID=A0A1F4T4X8_UNCSA|nr:MAG: tRNA pseudouridine(55) synthase TruB [candidate division WOR-1 bacterium RIFOXYA2_FULL_51_19]OGC17183.1 MAG: tRNA pseudouridine(55) synthase TruB [candidate division WOR-1 bacterium RIFOXYA12_FULL_52_29]OGC26043.1 MAG: tRNA pseudouridine(55) synthase TruB [candidate division WOR-1 bacterium RIFOXYB2_FULL_45_9]OGC27600.1 MAG: tRNA pseudouridine(55) synthase TruB [candidate division WOR-1 bacterium RIFOXYC12_FULL_54_18]OGC29186.1 MAG: tRNA pseudouridine(55) synthase TruB [candidate divisi